MRLFQVTFGTHHVFTVARNREQAKRYASSILLRGDPDTYTVTPITNELTIADKILFLQTR